MLRVTQNEVWHIFCCCWQFVKYYCPAQCTQASVSLRLGRLSTGAVTINYQDTLDVLLNVTA